MNLKIYDKRSHNEKLFEDVQIQSWTKFNDVAN